MCLDRLQIRFFKSDIVREHVKLGYCALPIYSKLSLYAFQQISTIYRRNNKYTAIVYHLLDSDTLISSFLVATLRNSKTTAGQPFGLCCQ